MTAEINFMNIKGVYIVSLAIIPHFIILCQVCLFRYLDTIIQRKYKKILYIYIMSIKPPSLESR